MKKIKIITSYEGGYDDDPELLFQAQIDKWINEKNPDIISCSLSIDAHCNRHIAILYEDNNFNI